MRLEALNHSQLVSEQDRIMRAIPRVSTMADRLGTDEGPERYRYTDDLGLSLVDRIEHVGELRHRMRSVALPALAERKDAVDRLITGYPERLQTAEERFSRMQEQPEKYTPDELLLAEQALLTARIKFQAPSIEELAEEITASPIITPTPEIFRHLTILNEGNRVVTNILSEGAKPAGKVVNLTRDEARVLDVLSRARILEQRRLKPAELAERAFPGQSASEVGLSLVMTGLRAKLNLFGSEFINSQGATRGPAVLYGIAEEVFIRAEALEQEKERVERLGKLRKLLFKREGSKEAAFFNRLAEHLGQLVNVKSTQVLRNYVVELRKKLADKEKEVDGFEYKIQTAKTRGRGLNYKLVEVRISTPERIEVKAEESDEPATPTASLEEAKGSFFQPLLLDIKPRDPYQQIKRRDPDIVGKLENLAAKAVDSGVEDDLEVPQIAVIFGVPDHIVEKAIEDRQVRVSGFEGHHGKISPGEAVFLAALIGHESNLTPVERKQLRKLAKEILATAFREKEKNGNKGKNRRKR